MRLEVFEFVMLVMLAREGRRCGWGFALGVARLASFSLSGVACLEAEDGLGMVVEERGVGVREAMEVRRQDAHADAGPDELMRRMKGGPTHPLRLSRVREREYVCVCECVCECVGVCFPWKIRRDASLCCFSRRVLFFFLAAAAVCAFSTSRVLQAERVQHPFPFRQSPSTISVAATFVLFLPLSLKPMTSAFAASLLTERVVENGSQIASSGAGDRQPRTAARRRTFSLGSRGRDETVRSSCRCSKPEIRRRAKTAAVGATKKIAE